MSGGGDMRYLIIALLAYAVVVGIIFVIDVSEIPAKYKLMLAILVSLPFVALIVRLSKRMSKLESSIFVVVIIAAFATSSVLRDVERGHFSLSTFLALFALVGGVARVVYLLIRTRQEGIILD
jgi:ABC-type transport system involved in cytochrome c biogenesis permease subunit